MYLDKLNKKTFKNPKISINKVYTKVGDKGYTYLIGGKKVLKSNIRVDIYGELDELNSIVGLCREELDLIKDVNLNDFDLILLKLQHQIFNLGNMIATEDLESTSPQVTKDDIGELEQTIDDYNNKVDNLSSFVLPGGNKLNAFLHLARTVTRRVERKLIALCKKKNSNNIELIFINRLSDAFFVWSRWIVKELNDKEVVWDPNFRQK